MKTKQLLEKYGATFHLHPETEIELIQIEPPAMEDLLKEYLTLNSGEAVAQLGFDSIGGEPALEIYCNMPNGIHKLYLANPINQKLQQEYNCLEKITNDTIEMLATKTAAVLNSHKRLEQALYSIKKGKDYYSPTHEIIREALASIPQQFRNINEVK